MRVISFPSEFAGVDDGVFLAIAEPAAMCCSRVGVLGTLSTYKIREEYFTRELKPRVHPAAIGRTTQTFDGLQ
jgi:hypothetical protein